MTVKAAFHVHSEWSYDAKLPLADIAALFRRHHFDVVFMCEHDRGFSAERQLDPDAVPPELFVELHTAFLRGLTVAAERSAE